MFGVGRDLAESQIDSMSEEQKMQLKKLQESASSIGVQMKTEAGDNPYEDVKPR